MSRVVTVEIAGQRVVNPLNQEVVSIRGVVPGEYVVNVHLYRADGDLPVLTKVKVEKLNPRVEVVFYGEVILGGEGDEQTAVRFSVRPDGGFADVNRLPRSIVPFRRLAAGAEAGR